MPHKLYISNHIDVYNCTISTKAHNVKIYLFHSHLIYFIVSCSIAVNAILTTTIDFLTKKFIAKNLPPLLKSHKSIPFLMHELMHTHKDNKFSTLTFHSISSMCLLLSDHPNATTKPVCHNAKCSAKQQRRLFYLPYTKNVRCLLYTI